MPRPSAPLRPRSLAPLLPLLAALLACSTLLPPRPEVRWDPNPEAVIIRATYCCGLVPVLVAENYIPDVLIWGDGRILWVESTGSGRRVMEGQLTAAQMEAVLQRAVNAGFFGWRNSYGDYSVTDMANQCLTINLSSQSKTVCEYYRGAPRAFHDLYGELAGGAGASAAEFVPDRAYLIAYPYQPNQSQPAPQPILHWPAGELGFSLAEAAGGAWVEGEALELAWRTVNAEVWGGGLVQDGETFYQLSMLVPGVSQVQPPSDADSPW